MADYFLDDAANVTNDGLSWETCYNTWAQVNTAAILTAANRLIVGADANITDPGAALTITGPTSGLPTTIISSTVATGTTVAYSVGTGKQVDTDSGAYAVTFDGSFALYGLRIASGAGILFSADTNETMYSSGLYLLLGANGSISTTGGSATASQFLNVTVDCAADGTSDRTGVVFNQNAAALCIVDGFTLLNGAYRMNGCFAISGNNGILQVSGADVSCMTRSGQEISQNGFGSLLLSNVKTHSSWTPETSVTLLPNNISQHFNVGPEDAPTYLFHNTYFGKVVSDRSIYRTGGAAVEGDACSWLITTTANCGEGAPFYTPWMYGVVSSTGSKTFDCYITNDTADFTDAQVWLEVEYLATADDAKWTLATDQRATITTTAQPQDDDTASTWNGTGPSFTYKQKLSVPAVIGETGQFRCRVAVGVASIAGSRFFYVDPDAQVT